MDKILAIKGHPTRGKEVIGILKTIGNKFSTLEGNDTHCIYYNLKDDKYIQMGSIQKCNQNNFNVFTLEEFLEKYPFKVGDKVTCKNLLASDSIYVVKKMMWVNNQIKYTIHNQCHDKYNFTVFIAAAEDLQHHEDETYIDCTVNNNVNNDSKPGVTVNGEKLIPPKGYTIKTATMDGDNLIVEYVKNKPQYPKTFEECCNMLGCKANDFFTNLNHNGCDIEISDYEDKIDDLLQNFRKLIYCRDAYWKIAGDWKPSFGENFIYAIGASYGTIQKIMVSGGRGILIFPTEEMRDAFFENFKDTIEGCKEFL